MLDGTLRAPVGGDSPILAARRGDWVSVRSQLAQRWIPGRQNWGAAGAARAVTETWGGTALVVGSKTARRAPLLGELNRALTLKYAPKRRIQLF